MLWLFNILNIYINYPKNVFKNKSEISDSYCENIATKNPHILPWSRVLYFLLCFGKNILRYTYCIKNTFREISLCNIKQTF